MAEKTEKERIDYLYFIQTIACFAVVFLHTNGCFWNFSATGRYWKTANVIETFFYFAVPFFFMISGITLMDYGDRYSLKEYLLKRFNKTFVPFFVWSFIGLAYALLTHRFSVGDISFKFIVDGFINTKFTTVYWFFIPLFSVYLCIPLFAMTHKEKRKELFLYLIIIGLIFNVTVPFVNKFVGVNNLSDLRPGVVAGYLIWPVIGYYIHNYPPKKVIKIVLILLSIAGFCIHLFGTYYYSMRDGGVNSFFKGYNALPCVMYSVGMFLILKDLGLLIAKTKVIRVFKFIAGYTFPIYLMHWYMHDAAIRLFDIDNRSIYYRLSAPFAIVLATIGITWIIRKIPILKRIVP